MSYSYIICPSCRARDYPNGIEEFCCTHGCYPCVCSRCGAKKETSGLPYWTCSAHKPPEQTPDSGKDRLV